MLDSNYSGLTLLGTLQSTYEWVAGQATNQKLKELHESYGDKLIKIEEGLFLLLRNEVFISVSQRNITDVEAITIAVKPYLSALGKKGHNMVVSTPTCTPKKMKLCFEGNLENVLEDNSIKLLRSDGIPDNYYQYPQKIPITFTKHRHAFVGLMKVDFLKSHFGINFKPYQGTATVEIPAPSITKTGIGFESDSLIIPNHIDHIEPRVSLEKYVELAQKKPMLTSEVESELFLKRYAKQAQKKPLSPPKPPSNHFEPRAQLKKDTKYSQQKPKPEEKTNKSKSSPAILPKEGKKSRQFATGWLLITMMLVAMTCLWNPQNTVTATFNQTVPVYEHTATSFKDSNLEILELAVFDGNHNTDWTPIKSDFNGTTMVLVPAGSFSMGSSTEQIDNALLLCSEARSGKSCERLLFEDEEPTNKQQFTNPFWLDETEVTRAAYESCVSASACTPTPDNQYSTTANQPMNHVTWYQASTYCAWREARLPTEAEWEYAARGPNGLEYPWGNTIVGDESNHCDGNCAKAYWGEGVLYKNQNHDDAFAETAPVGSYLSGKSWIGALDMSGNVWEWTSSLYKEYPYNKTDGREITEGENSTSEQVVLRGGSFVDNSDYVRAADRYQVVPDVGFDSGGFRCARSNY